MNIFTFYLSHLQTNRDDYLTIFSLTNFQKIKDICFFVAIKLVHADNIYERARGLSLLYRLGLKYFNTRYY